MSTTQNVWSVYKTTSINNLKKGSSYLAFGILFDNLPYLCETLYIHYRVSPFKPFYTCWCIYFRKYQSSYDYFNSLYCFFFSITRLPNLFWLPVPHPIYLLLLHYSSLILQVCIIKIEFIYTVKYYSSVN